jgi:hypothetical protein
MNKITIAIETVNSAFADGNEFLELARILRKLAADYEEGNNPTTLRDINGNTVGHIDIET